MGSKIHELHRGNKPATVRGHNAGNSSVSPQELYLFSAQLQTGTVYLPMKIQLYMRPLQIIHEALSLSVLGSILLSRSDSKSGHCRIGVVEGSWISGIIDEIQMATVGVSLQPMLVDTKTRSTRTVPSEAQKRNGRFAPYICFPNHFTVCSPEE
jgi:hypothetical protein